MFQGLDDLDANYNTVFTMQFPAVRQALEREEGFATQ